MTTPTAAARDVRGTSALLPPGERYDVGGFCLHLQRRAKGRPAAVLDSGLVGNSRLWTNALAVIDPLTEAVAFHRAGYACSEPAPAGQPRSSRCMVEELRWLLRGAGVAPRRALTGKDRL